MKVLYFLLLILLLIQINTETLGEKAVKFALKQDGKGYTQRQCGPGIRCCRHGPNCWDCSGLVAGAWKAAGVKGLPNTTRDYKSSKNVKRIKKSELQKGDIIWSPGHVQLYIGNGKVCEAANPRVGVKCRKRYPKTNELYYRPKAAFKKTTTTAATTQSKTATTPKTTTTTTNKNNKKLGDIVVEFAKKQQGKGYTQKPCSKGVKCCRHGPNCFDCSGLVTVAWKKAGVTGLPGSTRDYAANKNIKQIKESELQKGDILWHKGHVQIYIGNGKICEAANPRVGVICRKRWFKGGVEKYYRPKAAFKKTTTTAASTESAEEEEEEELFA